MLHRNGQIDVVPATVLVRGTHIEKVDAHDAAAPSGATVVELGDALLAPALVNAHTHLSMACLRGIGGMAAAKNNVVEDLYYAFEQSQTEEDVRAFTRMGAYDSLLSGVGCVFDHYYFGKACAETIAETGLTALVAPTIQDLNGPGVGHAEKQIDDTLSIAADEKLAAAGVYAAIGAHATDTVSTPLFERLASIADEKKLAVHIHVSQSYEEFERAMERHGCSPVAYLERVGILDAAPATILVHALYTTHDDVRRLKSDRHFLGYCPFSQLQFGFPAHLPTWAGAKIPYVVGTDCGASNDTMDVQQELRLVQFGGAFSTTFGAPHRAFRDEGGLALADETKTARAREFAKREEHANPAQVIGSVTNVAGQVEPRLGVGKIAPQARANLVVYDMEHPALWPGRFPLRAMTMGAMAPAIDCMMVNGQMVGERGNFHRSILDSADVVEARREAGARLTALLKRNGFGD